MNQVLVAVLAFCALPCALGLSCYSCKPNDTALILCDNPNQLTMVNCTNSNATCAMTELMANVSDAKSYVLDCAEISCPTTNNSICSSAAMDVSNKGYELTKCTTTCSPGDNSNKPPGVMSSPTTTVMASTTPGVNMPSTTAKPSAGDKLRPFFVLLFMVLFTVILSNPAWQ